MHRDHLGEKTLNKRAELEASAFGKWNWGMVSYTQLYKCIILNLYGYPYP